MLVGGTDRCLVGCSKCLGGERVLVVVEEEVAGCAEGQDRCGVWASQVLVVQ